MTTHGALLSLLLVALAAAPARAQEAPEYVPQAIWVAPPGYAGPPGYVPPEPAIPRTPPAPRLIVEQDPRDVDNRVAGGHAMMGIGVPLLLVGAAAAILGVIGIIDGIGSCDFTPGILGHHNRGCSRGDNALYGTIGLVGGMAAAAGGIVLTALGSSQVDKARAASLRLSLAPSAGGARADLSLQF